MDNFEKFYSLKLKRAESSVATSLKRRYGGDISDRLPAALSRSSTYRELTSEKGREKLRQYYDENKDAIDHLIASNSPVTESAVAQKRVEIGMGQYFGANIRPCCDRLREHCEDMIANIFKKARVTMCIGGTNYRLSAENIERFIDIYEESGFSRPLINGLPVCHDYLHKRMINELTDGFLAGTGLDRKQYEWIFRGIAKQRIKEGQFVWHILDRIQQDMPVTVLTGLLAGNKFFEASAERIQSAAESYLRLKSDILDSIPDSYALLYPEARKMKRHFVLCLGPTNSGKTYLAVEELKKAQRGIYLAPLRLLAYEQFENLNYCGRACNLVTGEECIYIPCAEIQSSTIEMLDTDKHYDVAVIDEAQMIGDEFRGSAWTRAVLGACADRIFLCAAPHAEKILIKLIEECGDTYEIHRTERRTALEFDRSFSMFPDDVREGDALIVFTRRDVHAVAAELQHDGVRCSIIYGALPYDVRHEEARKFNTGETDVVVATDAIGMGLNMPIRRVVFIEDSKFDGRNRRELRPDEIQQIAGRAGRYGIFDSGYYSALYSPELIKEGVDTAVGDISRAIITFPPSLLDLDVSLSKILEKWNSIDDKNGYTKANIKTEMKLCRTLERLTSDKRLIYDLISIPIDERNPDVYRLWEELAESVIRHANVHLEDVMPVYSEKSGLAELETAYKLCDLLFHFSTKFWKDGSEREIIKVKSEISELTMSILGEQALTGRICRSCGRHLPWDYRYDICDKCYSRRMMKRSFRNKEM
ncbi:MAG: helicase [Oscillospiraceae bacterium]|nr:helicase [Oscillospiraceae bacterium]